MSVTEELVSAASYSLAVLTITYTSIPNDTGTIDAAPRPIPIIIGTAAYNLSPHSITVIIITYPILGANLK